jgi:RNA polymerase sigma factor (sigma-70 family)
METPAPMDGSPFRSRRRASTQLPPAIADAMPVRSVEVLPGVAPIVSLRSRRPGTVPLDAVYAQEHLGLFRYIKGVVRDQELAEDILQEAFLRLLHAMTAGEAPENAHAWLYRVATNLAISRARRSQTMARHLPELASSRVAASPEQQALEAERDRALRSALGALPVEMRAAIVLASHGFSAREIGTTIGKSEGAVRMLLSRGRLRVRRFLLSADIVRSGGDRT